jgi:hypothetical protein
MTALQKQPMLRNQAAGKTTALGQCSLARSLGGSDEQIR